MREHQLRLSIEIRINVAACLLHARRRASVLGRTKAKLCAHPKGDWRNYLQRLGSGVTVKRRTPTEQERYLMSALGQKLTLKRKARMSAKCQQQTSA
jgi:hypothetical protein